MPAQLLPFPNFSGAAISPIACFLRIGEAHRRLADLHAAERLHEARGDEGPRVCAVQSRIPIDQTTKEDRR
jgi:hypothetical protein